MCRPEVNVFEHVAEAFRRKIAPVIDASTGTELLCPQRSTVHTAIAAATSSLGPCRPVAPAPVTRT